ncbi:UNVERIFIED_CONTAM: hypothetical protein HDU68_006842 [Siphonaria sp. JEL0065]|nr:hypothetical protein HDU68_006842 [Siphonaria sp. JEL0065]
MQITTVLSAIGVFGTPTFANALVAKRHNDQSDGVLIASFKSTADVVSGFHSIVDSLPTCAHACVASQFVTVSGSADLTAGIVTFDDILAACQESHKFNTGYLNCISKCNDKAQPCVDAWTKIFSGLCNIAAAQDTIDIKFDASQQDNTATMWSKYYNSTMSDYDWVNLREGIKTIVQVKQYGPVFLRLAWHDTATGNIWKGTGGPHATMNLQDPEDPQNKGLQRAIDALEPLYALYQDKISLADLWSYAGAVAVRVMGGPNTKWRPGRQDITDISQARLKSPDNDLPRATDSWATIKTKFESMGLNVSDVAALLHGGHGVGRCHREYSGYHGPWTGQENTFSNFYGAFLAPAASKTNESLPAINSWQRNGINPVNGGLVMELPSDVVMVEEGFLDFPHSTKPGVPGPGANKEFLSFSGKGVGGRQVFFEYFAYAFAKLLEVTLDPDQLGGFVSTDVTDPYGWVPVV